MCWSKFKQKSNNLLKDISIINALVITLIIFVIVYIVSDLQSKIQNSILASTAWLIAWYSIETKLMKEETKYNNQLSIAPVLTVAWEKGENYGDGYDLYIENIGKGAAVNIFIKKIDGKEFDEALYGSIFQLRNNSCNASSRIRLTPGFTDGTAGWNMLRANNAKHNIVLGYENTKNQYRESEIEIEPWSVRLVRSPLKSLYD